MNKKTNKPALEKIDPSFGSSVLIKRYDRPPKSDLKFWHFHPEIELVYVNGGQGKRHIGSHISYFRNGELVMIGSNLPHFGFTDRFSNNKSETVIQMKPDFLGADFFNVPEMESIHKLFERAKMGISFHNDTKRRIGAQIEDLADKKPFDRLISILNILKDLSETDDYQLLNAEAMGLEIKTQDNNRIDIIYNYVRDHFRETIRLEDIADQVSMTVPSFCRYFKRITGKTFTQFVNEYRLVHASKLLSERATSITDICYESGFNNFSHFNKLFKEFTGKNPSEYRNELKYILK